MTEFLAQEPVDYLFSVINHTILPPGVLNLPRQCAINYHDSPLPRYAGLYSTSWALMHRETSYAITWHVMNAEIDQGAILKQVAVEITSEDTALTLNAKCYEAAIAAFSVLIDELATGTARRIPQPESGHSYFSRLNKPPQGIQFHWQRSAEELEALVRALNFGFSPNALGTPKLILQPIEAHQPLLVTQLEVLELHSTQPAGTITAIATDHLQVATATRDIVLRKLLTLQGQPMPIAAIVAQTGIQVGDGFAPLSDAQRQQIDQFDSRIARHERFWTQRLRHLKSIALPEILRRPQPLQAAPSLAASSLATFEQTVPEVVLRKLRGVLPDTSIVDFFTASFAVYLNRLSGLDCFDLGFSYPELQDSVVGLEHFFAVQVPYRVGLSPQQGFRQILSATSDEIQQVKRRQTHTADIVARYPDLKAKAELQSEALFAVSVHQVKQTNPAVLNPHTCGRDLTLLIPAEGRCCGWVYNSAILDSDRIAQIADQFNRFLQLLVADVDRCLSDVPLPSLHQLSAAERQQILVEWNATSVKYPTHLCLHHLFEAQVERTPTAIAVVFADQKLTYAGLNQRANQLAHALQALGVQPEVPVGICIERSLAMVIGLLAILKAGGAYVPLDPTYPLDRLAHILDDAQPAAVLTLEKFLPLLPTTTAPTLCLDTLDLTAESTTHPDRAILPENLAYIIYTSGSTGKPKGVLIEHRGAVNTILDINNRFQVQPSDRGLAVCSLNFDLSVYDIFGLLAVGGTIVLPEPAIAPDLDRWIDLMEQEQVTLWNSAPPVMQLFARHLSDSHRSFPASLRLVLLSGDWIPLSLPEFIRELKFEKTRIDIISLGGATEASIWSILYPITVIDPDWKSIPYGKPMANQQFYILDRGLNPVAIGDVGELFIGGAGVARGYHNRPDLNASKFLPDPFSCAENARLYRTGDLGRYRADGTIEFLGRIDHQVKIRGFRVEIGEIEALLAKHPDLRETAVLAREDVPGEKRLVAYLVCDRTSKSDTKALIDSVRHFLKAKLPDYMVPSAFVPLDSLPLTPNGKLDRQALPAPAANQELSSSAVAPRDEIEQQLVQIWQECLNVRQIGITDNFFELGGHSLLAARLWTQIETVFACKLPLVTLFQAPTIAQVAERLRQTATKPLCPSLVVIQPGRPDRSKPPLFCIHVLGRGLKFYRPMLPYLDPEQPIYGLSTNIAGEDYPSLRVEDLATHYVRQIQTLQPQGPYLLIGASFGGLVAFEMAQQLQAIGQQVSLLGILDTRLAGSMTSVPMSKQVSQHWKFFSRLGPAYILKKMQERSLGETQRLRLSLKRYYYRLGIKFCAVTGGAMSEKLQDFMYEQQNRELAGAYATQPYRDRITLFKASELGERVRATYDDAFGWRTVAAGGLDIYTIPGSHLGMLQEPNVKILSGTLRLCIARAVTQADAAKPEPSHSALLTEQLLASR
jgi:amino acid adenylation domain-containing protein